MTKFQNNFNQPFSSYVYDVATAGGTIDDKGYACILEPGFAGDGRLGHRGHADVVRTITLEPIDFGRSFKAWSLGRRINATVITIYARLTGGFEQAGS